jgi:hypothetical protein
LVTAEARGERRAVQQEATRENALRLWQVGIGNLRRTRFDVEVRQENTGGHGNAQQDFNAEGGNILADRASRHDGYSIGALQQSPSGSFCPAAERILNPFWRSGHRVLRLNHRIHFQHVRGTFHPKERLAALILNAVDHNVSAGLRNADAGLHRFLSERRGGKRRQKQQQPCHARKRPTRKQG